MTADHEASRVDALVVQWLARVEEQPGRADEVLAELCATHPEEAEALRRSVDALAASGLLEATARDQEMPETLGEFRILEVIGKGGMGLVYRAHQPGIDRQVALKLIRPDQLYYPGARPRFEREARAVARLSHPNIVQVHAVGEQQGIPYLAMEYLEGVPLDELIRAVADLERPRAEDARAAAARLLPDAGDWDEEFWSGPWHRFALRVALAVARALSHAHHREVLHRDVKPSNVMLLPSGRVVLLDFGLAALTGDDRMTRSGAQLGSLPYMAPEQLEGRHEEVGASTDVYGVGVTFYELLTRRAAYHDPSSSERTRARVLEGRPTWPRGLDPTIPKDVQAICLVAIDLEPQRRYGSADELVNDLDAALHGRAVKARPAGTWTHLTRWASRQPFAAGATAVALLAIVGGPTGCAVERSLAADRYQAQLERADLHLTRSSAALRLLGDVAMYRLENVPGVSEARRELLEATRRHWEDTLAVEGERGSLTLEEAVALEQLGRLQHHLDDPDAEATLRQALGVLEESDLEQVVLGKPVADHLARVLSGLSQILSDQGLVEESTKMMERARGALRTMGAEAPEVRFDIAVADVRQAMILNGAGQRAEARALLDDALPVLEAQFAGATTKDRYVYLAFAYGQEAYAASLAGDEESMLDWLDRSAEVYRKGLERWPGNRDMRNQLFVTHFNRSIALRGLDRHEESLTDSEAALEMAIDLQREFPDYPEMRANLAAARSAVGGSLYALKRHEEAREPMRLGWVGYQQLLEELPGNVPFLIQGATGGQGFANLLVDLGEYEAFVELLPEVKELNQEALASAPQYPPLLENETFLAFGECRALLGLEQDAQALEMVATLPVSEPDLALILAADLATAALRFPETEREAHCAAAVAMLQRGIDGGLRTVETYTAPVFAVLAGREDYAAILDQL